MKQKNLFTTDNLAFKPVTEEDLPLLLQLDSDPETMHFFPGGVRTQAEIEIKIKKYVGNYHKKKYGVFIIFDTKIGEFIGRAGFDDIESGEIEVGYIILRKYWGQGYATRILKALLSWARTNIQKDKVIAYTPVDHTASQRVMQKAGMIYTKTGIMKGVDCVIYEFKL